MKKINRFIIMLRLIILRQKHRNYTDGIPIIVSFPPCGKNTISRLIHQTELSQPSLKKNK